MKKLAPILLYWRLSDDRSAAQFIQFKQHFMLLSLELMWSMEKRKEICLQDEMFSYQMFSFLFKRLYFIRVWSHNTYLRPLRILYPSRNNPYELLPPSLSLNPLLPRVICALYKRNWWIVSLLKDLWRNGRNTPWNCMLHISNLGRTQGGPTEHPLGGFFGP